MNYRKILLKLDIPVQSGGTFECRPRFAMAGIINAYCARDAVPAVVAARIPEEQALRQSMGQLGMIDCAYGQECFCSREKISKKAKCCSCQSQIDPRDGSLNVLAKMGPKTMDPAGNRLWQLCMPCYFAWAHRVHDTDPCEGSGCATWRKFFYELNPSWSALATVSAATNVSPPPPPHMLATVSAVTNVSAQPPPQPPSATRLEVDALRELIASLEKRVFEVDALRDSVTSLEKRVLEVDALRGLVVSLEKQMLEVDGVPHLVTNLEIRMLALETTGKPLVRLQ
jgi:hypothetical protein